MMNDQVNQLTLLTPKQVAQILGVTPHTLAVWRCKNRYPRRSLRYIKTGSKVMYRAPDVEAFIEKQAEDVAAA